MIQYEKSIKVKVEIDEKHARIQMQALERQIVTSTGKVVDLRAKMISLNAVKLPTQQYLALEDKVSAINKKHDSLIKLQKTVAEGMQKIAKVTKDSFSKAGSLIEQAGTKIKKFGEFAKTSISNVGGLVSSVGSKMKGFASSFLSFFHIDTSQFDVISLAKEGLTNLYNENSVFKDGIDSLSGSLTTLKNGIGAAFAPLVELAIPYIKSAMEWITKAIDLFGQFIAKITGKQSYTKALDQSSASSDSSGGKSNNETGASMFAEMPISSEINDFVQSFNEVGVEIWNNILEIVTGVRNMIGELAVSTAQWVSTLDFTPLLESVNTLLLALQPLTENIATGLEWLWNNILLPIAGWTMQEALPVFLDLLSAAITLLNSVIEAFEPLGVWLWENFLQPMGEWTGELLLLAITSISDALTWLSGIVSGNKGSVEGLIGTLDGMLKPALEFFSNTVLPDLNAAWNSLLEILEPLAEFVAGVFLDIWEKGIKPAFEYLTNQVIPGLASVFANLWNQILVPLCEFLGSILKPAIDIIADCLNILWKHFLVPIGEFIGNIFAKSFEALVAVFNKGIAPAVNDLIAVFQFLWNKVLSPIVDFLWNNFMTRFESVFNVIGDLIGSLSDIFGGFITFIGGIFSNDLGMALEGIKQIFNGNFNSIASVVENILNFIINVVNDFLGGLDKVVSTVGGVIGLDVSVPKIPKVHIPRLATGTIIPPNREFLAILGDNKSETEVVSPLSTIEQAVENALNRNGGVGGEITVKVPVNIDGREIFEIVKKLEHEQFHRTGRPTFSY